MSSFFLLDENNNIVPCNVLEWGEFLENTPTDKRRVGRDIVDGKLISTVFLGLDHSHSKTDLHIFETMVFENEVGGSEIYIDRCDTWQEAKECHKEAIEWVKQGSKKCHE